MTAIVLLFALGLVLLAFEVFLPGAVLGILGGLCLLAGCGVAFKVFGFGGGLTAVGAAAALLGGTFYLELAVLPKTKLGRRMFLDAAIAGASQPLPADPQTVVGQVGETLTTLAPSGFVLVAGKKYEASSQAGLVARGTAIKVTGLDNFRLLVSPHQSS